MFEESAYCTYRRGNRALPVGTVGPERRTPAWGGEAVGLLVRFQRPTCVDEGGRLLQAGLLHIQYSIVFHTIAERWKSGTLGTVTRAPGGVAAVGYMVIAVMSFSLIPLVVYVSGGSQAPLIFNAWFRAGIMLGSFSFLLVFYHRTFLDRNVLLLVWARVYRWPDNKFLLGTVLSTLEFVFLSWSVKYLDITTAAILFETWPVWVILLASWVFREEERYRKITFTTMMLVALSLAGFVFAIASQTSDLLGLDRIVLGRWIIGVVLVVLATAIGSFSVFGLKWGVDSRRAVNPGVDSGSLDLCFAVLAFSIASVVSATVSLIVGLASGESLIGVPPVSPIFGLSLGAPLIALLGGICTYVVGTIAWRKANLTTDNLGINAVAFVTPILSLFWLYWLAQADVARWDFLTIGTAAVISANLLISFEAEIRWGFKALILGLGTFGAVVYLRDGVFEFIGISPWSWDASGYFESVTLAATLFTLLLAFRVARLVARTSEEDNRTFIVYRNLELLARRGVVDGSVCDDILEIDKSNDLSLVRVAYVRAWRRIAEITPDSLNEADSQLLSQAESNLDALVRSKQVDIHLGEMFALVIFSTITIVLAILSVPAQVVGWTRLLTDVFAMVVSSVIIFLLVHIQDLQRERGLP